MSKNKQLGNTGSSNNENTTADRSSRRARFWRTVLFGLTYALHMGYSNADVFSGSARGNAMSGTSSNTIGNYGGDQGKGYSAGQGTGDHHSKDSNTNNSGNNKPTHQSTATKYSHGDGDG